MTPAYIFERIHTQRPFTAGFSRVKTPTHEEPESENLLAGLCPANSENRSEKGKNTRKKQKQKIVKNHKKTVKFGK